MATERLTAATPGRPMWLAALGLAVVATAALCWPAWPGHMGYDALFAYAESKRGITTMTWPPLHAYLFWVSRHLGAETWGLFTAQTFALFFGANVAASLLVARRPAAVAAMVLFALAFVFVPPMLGVAMMQWRDVTVASFWTLSLALWLLAAQRRSFALFAAAAAALGCSVALRYNAFPLFALSAPLMVWRPYLAPASWRLRIGAALTLAACVGLAVASTQWRLPDLKRLPAVGTFSGVQLFDLMGISACSGRNYLPAASTDGWPITVNQIRTAYDPKHLNRAFAPQPGQPTIQNTDGYGAVQAAWRETVPKEFGCYLAHRTLVLMEQMGMAREGVFYPAHHGIDPNPYGLKVAHREASEAVTRWVGESSKQLWRRPFLLYVGAALVTLTLLVRRSGWSLLAVALLGGAVANCALLFLIGPAADARYIFPSNALCALLIAAGLGALAAPPRESVR